MTHRVAAPPSGSHTCSLANPGVNPCSDLRNKIFSGVVKVHLHCANDLRSVGLLSGYANPYVEVFVSGGSFRSQRPKAPVGGGRPNLSNPTWDEEHYLYIR
jgi:hypothetical protein